MDGITGYTIAGAVLWAGVCWAIARHLGRSRTTGAILGFLFGLWAVVGYGILAFLDKRKARREHTPSRPDL